MAFIYQVFHSHRNYLSEMCCTVTAEDSYCHRWEKRNYFAAVTARQQLQNENRHNQRPFKNYLCSGKREQIDIIFVLVIINLINSRGRIFSQAGNLLDMRYKGKSLKNLFLAKKLARSQPIYRYGIWMKKKE